ncbi:unnamed protein product, partial [Mesorhabditis belari]|uniref:polyribonucleotide nucleotidyltransferase n=1 Tax=Mesorhabditis belari TaxID=2138241 RepID=A0AAF3FBC7_9BILA
MLRFIIRNNRGHFKECKRYVSAKTTIGQSELVLTAGEIARFADSAVVASTGDNAVLATCVYQDAGQETDGVPLTVDFRQSAAALGRIPMNFLRKEMSQTDNDILTSRVIDRALRPMISKSWTNPTAINIKPMALDEDCDGIILGLNAAACALHLSSVPLINPVASVRVSIINDEIMLNPPRHRLSEGMSMVLAGTRAERAVMIEMEGPQVTIEQVEEAITQGLSGVDQLLDQMDSLKKSAGKPKLEIESVRNVRVEKNLYEKIRIMAEERLEYIFTDPTHDKISRDDAIKEVRKDVLASFDDFAETSREFNKLVRYTLRRLTINSGIRCDGRGVQDFRPISIKVDVYKKLHGSALFQRGQTQVFSTVTFDSPAAAFHPDSISQLLGAQQRKSFMLHYEFPGFATNEISSNRGSNRREIGHGFLAEKALKHVIPDHFPYAIRISSQVLESNGSSSMASACAGSLALYDAGVPLKAPVAGVAIGLMTNDEKPDEKYQILTDILGIEDYLGDMDFKIAGTSNGFTSMQMDVKIPGLTRKQLSEAIRRGKSGVDFMLSKMANAQENPRNEFKSSVPVLETLKVDPYKRSNIFRNGGLIAKTIEAATGVRISIDDETQLALTAPSRKRMDEAKEMLNKLLMESTVEDYNFGQLVQAEVTEAIDRGVLVRLQTGAQTHFIPNSQLSNLPIKHPSAAGIDVGQKLTVQWLGRDPQTGKVRLSKRLVGSASVISRINPKTK